MNESRILGAFRAAAARRPDATALVSPRETVSYAALECRAAAVAAKLAGTVGSVVGLLYPNSPDFVAGFLGALWAGKTAAVFPSIAPPKLILLLATQSGIRNILVAEELAPGIAAVGLQPIVVRPSDAPGRDSTQPSMAPLKRDAAVLLYTSGTTGVPKAVALSEANVLANIEGCCQAGPFTADDVMLAILPLFHAFGLTVTLLLPLTLGGKVVLEDRFVPRTSLEAVSTHRVTALIGVPGQFRLLAKEPAGVDAESLRLCISGAERLGEHVREAFAQRFDKQLLQGYGATESSPVISFNRPSQNRPGSVGLPLHNVRLSIRDGSQALPRGEHGEVCVEGSSVMLGYFGNPKATEAKVPGRVLHMGDHGWIDPDGFLYLTGRADDMVKVGGEKVYPAEIERVLEQIEGVEEAAVVGITSEARGTTLAGFVAPHPGATLDAAAVRNACRDRLEIFKTPKTFTVVPQLPRSASGKVDKRALLEIATRPR